MDADWLMKHSRDLLVNFMQSNQTQSIDKQWNITWVNNAIKICQTVRDALSEATLPNLINMFCSERPSAS